MFLEKVLRIGFTKNDEIRSMATWILLLGFWGVLIFSGADTSNVLVHLLAFNFLFLCFWNVYYYNKDNPFHDALGLLLFGYHNFDQIVLDVAKSSLVFFSQFAVRYFVTFSLCTLMMN